jgi:hypothetical protein
VPPRAPGIPLVTLALDAHHEADEDEVAGTKMRAAPRAGAQAALARLGGDVIESTACFAHRRRGGADSGETGKARGKWTGG